MKTHVRIVVLAVLLCSNGMSAGGQFPVGDANRDRVPQVAPQVPPAASSDETMFDWYQRTTLDVVSKFRNQLSTVLGPSERERERGIVYEIVRSNDPFLAEAGPSGEMRVIRVSVGFVRILETVVEAGAVAIVDNDQDIVMNYLRYLASAFDKSRASGAPIQLFPQWRGWSEEERIRKWKEPRLGMQRSQALYAAFAFVVAHETAHILYGHKPYKEKSAAQARADETEADSFAADKLLAVELPPSAAVTLIGFWSILGNNPIETENASTHPADERRLYMVLDRNIKAMEDNPDFQRYLIENNLVEGWKRAEEANRVGAREIASITAVAASKPQPIPRGSIKFAPY